MGSTAKDHYGSHIVAEMALHCVTCIHGLIAEPTQNALFPRILCIHARMRMHACDNSAAWRIYKARRLHLRERLCRMQQTIEGINVEKFSSNMAVGGGGGDMFSLIGHANFFIKTITFHREKGVIRCLSCQKFDGTSIYIGNRATDPKPIAFTFSTDEVIQKMYLYSTPLYGGRFAGIKVITDRQHCLEAYAYDYTPRAQDEVEVAVGVGKWNGIFGRSGTDIDSFGVAILRTPPSY